MPSLRGISISINAHYDQAIHPEYRECRFQRDGNPQATLLADDEVLNDSVSVYIPSMSAERFFVKYSVAPPFSEGVQFYFKMFMNGRHINSWGINPRLKSRGQVTKCLFQGEELDYNNKGAAFIRVGVAARTLMFAQQEPRYRPTTAHGGGDIEVLVFRASGKRKRTAAPQPSKDQGEFGIIFPSSGLVASPAEDAKFYDWLLIDPNDAPYASFKFYYRTWEELQSLQIIPHYVAKGLLPVSRSFGTLSEYMAKGTMRPVLAQDGEELEQGSKIPSPLISGDAAIACTQRKLAGILKQTSQACEKILPDVPETGQRNNEHTLLNRTQALEDISESSGPSLTGQSLRSVKSHRNLIQLSSKTDTVDHAIASQTHIRPLPQPPCVYVDARPSMLDRSGDTPVAIKHRKPQQSRTRHNGPNVASIAASLKEWVMGSGRGEPSPSAVECLESSVAIDHSPDLHLSQAPSIAAQTSNQSQEHATAISRRQLRHNFASIKSSFPALKSVSGRDECLIGDDQPLVSDVASSESWSSDTSEFQGFSEDDDTDPFSLQVNSLDGSAQSARRKADDELATSLDSPPTLSFAQTSLGTSPALPLASGMIHENSSGRRKSNLFDRRNFSIFENANSTESTITRPSADFGRFASYHVDQENRVATIHDFMH